MLTEIFGAAGVLTHSPQFDRHQSAERWPGSRWQEDGRKREWEGRGGKGREERRGRGEGREESRGGREGSRGGEGSRG